MTTTVQAQMARLWRWSDDFGLLDGLAADAVLARVGDRSDPGENRRCTPRLITLLVAGGDEGDGGLDRSQSVAAMATAADVGRDSLDDHRDLLAVFEAWWRQTLQAEPSADDPSGADPWAAGSGAADRVLSLLARYPMAMRHWLDLWLADLDGPGAIHLAEVILTGLGSPNWNGLEDQAGQVLAWARTETVVNGVTLIGGTHLGRERLGLLLDRLI